MENINKESFENMKFEEKNMFEKMILSATLGMLRGIDMDLYSQTTNEMSNFLKDFQSLLMKTNFTNEDLAALKSFLNQGRKIIKDIEKGENNV